MADLVLRPSQTVAGKPWALQLRQFDGAETAYVTIARVTDEMARAIVAAGPPSWLLGDPDEPR